MSNVISEGRGKVIVTVTVTDPDGTVTVFDEKQSQHDMGTPESRKAAKQNTQENT